MLENPYLGTFLETGEATGRSVSLGACPTPKVHLNCVGCVTEGKALYRVQWLGNIPIKLQTLLQHSYSQISHFTPNILGILLTQTSGVSPMCFRMLGRMLGAFVLQGK